MQPNPPASNNSWRVPTGYKTLIEHVCPLSRLSPPSRKLVLSLQQVECRRLPKLDLADVTGEEVIDAADMVDSMDIP